MKKTVSKKSKRRLMIFGMLSIVAIGYFFVTLIGYTYNYISLKQEKTRLDSELLSLQDEKSNLKTEIQKLNDPNYVARYAKEKYLYSGNGEYVIKIDDNIDSIINQQNNNTILTSVIGGSVIFILIILILRIKVSLKQSKKKKYKLNRAT